MAATRSLLAIVALALPPACGSSDDSTTVVVPDPIDEAVADGLASGDAIAGTANDELVGDDYDIVIGKAAGILAAINDGVIDQATFGGDIVQADDVFQFANDLVVFHGDANFDLETAVRFYGVDYLPSVAEDDVRLETSANLGVLRGTPPQDVDLVFLDLQVRTHAQAQVVLDELSAIVGPGVMGDYILDQQYLVDMHLAEAEAMLATFY